MYYRYWMHLAHFNIPAHYGIRTESHKLIYYYGEALDSADAIDELTAPEWELFDLEKDPPGDENLLPRSGQRRLVCQAEVRVETAAEQFGRLT